MNGAGESAPRCSRKKRYGNKTIAEKLAIIRMVDKGGKRKTDIAKEFGIPISTLSTILKMRDAIERYAAEGNSKNTERIRIRGGKYAKLESELIEWYCQANASNTHTTHQLIREKAVELAGDMNFEFKFSNGWLHRFLARHSVTIQNPNKRVESSPKQDAFRIQVASVVEQYTPNNIFSLDETYLYFMPEYDSSRKGECSKPHLNHRIAALYCCNAMGTEKLPPLIVGRTRKAENVELPCYYTWNDYASMSPKIFEEWLEQFEGDMKLQKRDVLLIVENPDSKSCQNKPHVQLLHLPSGQSSDTHPFKQGILRRIKCHYKFQINRSYKKNIGVTEEQAVRTACAAWQSFTAGYLRKCFGKTDIAYALGKAFEEQNIFDEIENEEHDDATLNVSCDDYVDDFDFVDTSQNQDTANKDELSEDSQPLQSIKDEKSDAKVKKRKQPVRSCARSSWNDNDDETKDEHSVYCESVSNRIRKLNDDYLTAIARNKIDQVLFEVEMMKYHKPLKDSPKYGIDGFS